MNLDDIKVSLAATSGLGNWLLAIDVLLKVSISVATLVYIIIKIKQQLNNK